MIHLLPIKKDKGSLCSAQVWAMWQLSLSWLCSTGWFLHRNQITKFKTAAVTAAKLLLHLLILLLSFASQKPPRPLTDFLQGPPIQQKMFKSKGHRKKLSTISLTFMRARSFWYSYLFLNGTLNCSPAFYKCFPPLLNIPKFLERWNISLRSFLSNIPSHVGAGSTK